MKTQNSQKAVVATAIRAGSSSDNKKAAAERLRYFSRKKSEIVQSIGQLVEIESPSDVKQAMDRLGAVLASRFEDLGGRVQIHRSNEFGNHLEINFSGSRGKPVLLLGHTDTVYPIGTLSKMPYRQKDGKLFGPGVLDMKTGIALILHSIEGLRDWNGGTLPRPVTVLLVSDEEVGSNSSRQITEKLAKQSAAVLVMEPSFGPKGAVKTGRKGVGEYALKVTGRAAHAGLDFESGQSAILELAKQIVKISGLVNLKRGITLSVGQIRGGSRTNVIAAEASAFVDVRAVKMKDAKELDRKLKGLRPFNSKCKLEILGGINRPPMERTPGVAALYASASAIAKELGWKLEEAFVGGGSDGNFTAALGIPTLDGLGGVGEGAHAPHESVVMAELPRRAALLTSLIETA